MKKYVGLALLVIVLLLIGNNFYQTRQFKAKKAANDSSAVNYSKTVDYPNVSPSAIPKEESSKPEQLMLAVINIGGFGCPSCPVIAENALKDTKGVLDARITSTGEASRVLYNTSVITIEDIRKVFSPAGYTIDKVISEQPSLKRTLD